MAAMDANGKSDIENMEIEKLNKKKIYLLNDFERGSWVNLNINIKFPFKIENVSLGNNNHK